MYKSFKKIVYVIILSVFVFSYEYAYADISPEAKKKLKSETLQHNPKNVMDQAENTISNFQFPVTNYGIFALDKAKNIGGGYWPRGSENQYFFGGGVWFAGTKKLSSTEGNIKSKFCLVTYNPNSGGSWMVPGRIYENGPKPGNISDYSLKADPNDIESYRVYMSSDYNTSSGKAFVKPSDDSPWPIWDSGIDDTMKVNRYFGNYIVDAKQRTKETYSKGPAFISGEDIFVTYKDTDLSRYEGNEAKRRTEGYPIYMQYEQYIYSWGFGDYKDFIFLRYDLVNYSADTLTDCYLAPVMDVDIARRRQASSGAANDRTTFYFDDPSLNLAVQWSNTDRGERGNGFGYLGFDFLESPAVVKYYRDTLVVDSARDDYGKVIFEKDAHGNLVAKMDTTVYSLPDPDQWLNKDTIWEDPDDKVTIDTIIKTPIPGMAMTNSLRKDKKVYSNKEQLGLVTMKNWNIIDDKLENNDRYDFLSSGEIDGDDEAGDKRFMMSTGPFHVLPKDTFRTVVAIILANTALGGDADGSALDMAELVRKDKFAQAVYDNNFRAPMPPDKALFSKWTPLNHAVTMEWDSTSEYSNDKNERGLDFMGYVLYRARRTDLDTFDLSEVKPGGKYSLGKGPLGWKELQRWQISTPFQKSPYWGGTGGFTQDKPLIDNFMLLGPAVDKNGNVPASESMAIKVMRVGQGMTAEYKYSTTSYMLPVITSIDTLRFYDPWVKHYKKLEDIGKKSGVIPDTGSYGYYDFSFANKVSYKNPNHCELFDNVLVGNVYLNPALLKYNPLYYKYEMIDVSREYLDSLGTSKYFYDYIVGDTVDILDSNGAPTGVKYRASIDTVYHYNTLERSSANSTGWVCAIETKFDLGDNPFEMMRDPLHVARIMDSLYAYIKTGKVTSQTTLPDFESTKEAKEMIAGYFDNITNGDRFMDFGDDNHDGDIKFDEDPLASEKLVNNVEYFYKLIAFDEGDFFQPTPKKYNVASLGLPNLIQTFPRAAEVGKKSGFKIISVDSNRIGSLNNFEIFAIDDDRANQLFTDTINGGHILELEFNPYWSQSQFTPRDADVTRAPILFGLYRSYITLRDTTTDDLLYTTIYAYELAQCNLSFYDLYSENATSVSLQEPNNENVVDHVTGDTITFHLRSNREYRQRNGSFTSGDFTNKYNCYANNMQYPAKGVLGFSFDYSMRQYGGVVRPDTAITNNAFSFKGNTGEHAATWVSFIDENANQAAVPNENSNDILITQSTSWDYSNLQGMDAGFNNGPGIYEIEFYDPKEDGESGEEEIELAYGWKVGSPFDNKATAKVNYLKMRIKNIYSYERRGRDGKDYKVEYPIEIKPMDLPILKSIDPVDFHQLSMRYPIEYLEKGSDTEREYNPFSEDRLYPDPRNLGNVSDNSLFPYKLNTNDFIDKYNLSSNVWVNRREYGKKVGLRQNLIRAISTKDNPAFDIIKADDYKNYDTYSGLKQNRYYLSGTTDNGGLPIDFNHELQINSCRFILDYAHTGFIASRANASWGNTLTKEENTAKLLFDFTGRDFKAGDKIYVGTIGGAAGFPLPKAKVLCQVTGYEKLKHSDSMMDDIQVVPNPYIITHQGQKTPYDSKIYFAKIPNGSTIEIFTIAGQLVKSINHTNNTTLQSGDKTFVDVWDLLNSNGQRVQSQSFIAVITAPNGSQTIKNFSVVVGGFKTIKND